MPPVSGETLEAIGDEHQRIDVLVNNAGFLANGPAIGAELADWHRMVDVNVGGVLNVTHAALPHVVNAAHGIRGVADIVTVSSVAGPGFRPRAAMFTRRRSTPSSPSVRPSAKSLPARASGWASSNPAWCARR